MTAPLDELGRLLAGAASPAISAQLPGLRGCPRVDVDDVGEVSPPLTPARLRALLTVAVPAPYGKGEQTLTDLSVRHTWQIPSHLVTVDWDGRLGDVLQEARQALGLPPSCRLRAEFHSLLVYERGQFFLPHQDSQTADEMVASLVVTLPSTGAGGELVVHDGQQATTYAASRSETSLVVFYADRRHEVRPVRSGHRIVLTYSILISGDTGDRPVDADLVTRAAALLAEYFTTSRSRWGQKAELPVRMAYLLDHEYPARGLGLGRLKGADADAAAVLATAAGLAGCELVLALAEVHETHDEFDLDGDPLDADITVTHWVTPDGAVEPTTLDLSGDDVAGTPSRRLTPYASEYEGYMGNYGNTMDRWYRRAALLLWPRRLAFAQRCETAPGAAMRELLDRLGQGEEDQVRRDLAGVAPSWPDIVGRRSGAGDGAAAESAGGLLGVTLPVAARIRDADLASEVLEPFRIEHLRPEAMGPLGAVGEVYGERWVRDLLQTWATGHRGFQPWAADQDWLLELPDLVRAVPERPQLAREVLAVAWERARQQIESRSADLTTTARRRALAELGHPVAALLEAATVIGDEARRTEMLTQYGRDELVEMVVAALDTAAGWPEPLRAASEATSLAAFAAARLQDQIDAPSRAADDWSLAVPSSCGCEVCAILDPFLADPARNRLEWPLAKAGRQHVHVRIDRAELPVTHVTRRTGRPFTLVLTKTREVFEREARGREQARCDAARLRDAWDLR